MNVVLTAEEARQLVGAVDPGQPFAQRDRALLVFALHTGLRVSELSGLDVRYVVDRGEPRQTLHLPAELGKGGRARLIPLNDTARKCVRVLLGFNAARGFGVAPECPLFVNRFHRRLSVRDIQRLVKALREAAGLDVPATPHSLRHTFGTRLMEATNNLRVCQAVLGHARLSTTEIYTHPSRELVAASVARLAR